MSSEIVDRESEFYIYDRNLPHWRDNAVIYFVTWHLHKSGEPLNPDERWVVADTLEHFNNLRYKLFAYVVMDDHVHVLVRVKPGGTLQKTVHGWKSYTANQLQKNGKRTGPIWQQEYYDRLVRNEQEFSRVLAYIAHNPERRWPNTLNYPWLRIDEQACNLQEFTGRDAHATVR